MKKTNGARRTSNLALAALLIGLFAAAPLSAAEIAEAPALPGPHDKAPELPVIERVPAASWINVKTDVEPRAVGDGVADDTAALQAGLDKLNGGGGNATVLYLPPGVYRITETLVMARANRVPGNMMIGHGAATRIVWDGDAAWDELPAEWAAKNVAPQATITASSEAEPEHAARFVADGQIAAPQSKNDNHMAWAAAMVKAPYSFPEGITLSFAWKEPVPVAEVVYYGRTAWLWTENFKNYELYLDDAATPVTQGILQQGHGPQRIRLPKVEAVGKLTLKFLDSYGDYRPGAAEVQIFTEPVPENVLPAFVRPFPEEPGKAASTSHPELLAMPVPPPTDPARTRWRRWTGVPLPPELAAVPLPAEWAAKNVAPQATITASSEAEPEHAARFVADGQIAAPQSKNDNHMAWAAAMVKAPYSFPEGITLSFAWEAPVQVAEVVYYGRTAYLWTENFRTYELYLDDAATPAVKGVLRQGHGPQRIRLPKVEAAGKLTLKFLDSYGDYCPGAAEVQIFTEPPPKHVLAPFVRHTPTRMFVNWGATDSTFSGIVFDGNNKASFGAHEEGTFKTACDWEYCAFINCADSGVRMGVQNPFATSETVYRHCVFANNGIGLAVVDFNYYNIVVDECVFRNNGTGVLATRHGQVYVRNSRFDASRERDLSLGDSHKHAVRRCVSTGSRTFIEGTHFTVQDCLVSDWKNPGGAIIIRSPAPPVLIFDCVFKDPPAQSAPIRAPAEARILLSNNTSPGTDKVIEGGTVVEVPAGKLGGTVSQAGLTLSFAPPPAPAMLFDADKDFNGDVQATIDAAREHGKGAVAYFPARGYPVKQTIKVHGADYAIRGDGFQTQFTWQGPVGGTVFQVEDPQNLALENFMIASYMGIPRDILCLRQTSTGKPSSVTYNKLYAGSHGDIYRADGATQVRGIEFRGLGRDSRVHVTRAYGSAAFIDCAAAEILLRFWNGGPIVVENPGQTPRTGFLGGLNANHVWELVVRDSLDVVFTEFYKEQGKYGYIQLYGSPADQPGRVTLGATRLHLWKESPFFARIDGYKGQLTYATADVTWDNSPDKYTVRQTSASPFTLVMLGHNRFSFDIQLDPSARLVRVANNGVADAIPEGGLDAISAALDHWRLLGQKDVEFRRRQSAP